MRFFSGTGTQTVKKKTWKQIWPEPSFYIQVHSLIFTLIICWDCLFFLNLLIFVLRFIKLSPHYYSRNAFILCCYRQNKICVSCSLPGCLSVAWEMWGDVWVRVSAFHGTVLQHCAAGGWIVESGVFPRRHKVMSCSCFVQTIGQSSYFLFSLL